MVSLPPPHDSVSPWNGWANSEQKQTSLTTAGNKEQTCWPGCWVGRGRHVNSIMRFAEEKHFAFIQHFGWSCLIAPKGKYLAWISLAIWTHPALSLAVPAVLPFIRAGLCARPYKISRSLILQFPFTPRFCINLKQGWGLLSSCTRWCGAATGVPNGDGMAAHTCVLVPRSSSRAAFNLLL